MRARIEKGRRTTRRKPPTSQNVERKRIAPRRGGPARFTAPAPVRLRQRARRERERSGGHSAVERKREKKRKRPQQSEVFSVVFKREISPLAVFIFSAVLLLFQKQKYAALYSSSNAFEDGAVVHVDGSIEISSSPRCSSPRSLGRGRKEGRERQRQAGQEKRESILDWFFFRRQNPLLLQLQLESCPQFRCRERGSPALSR